MSGNVIWKTKNCWLKILTSSPRYLMNLKPLQLKWNLATGITSNLIPFVAMLHRQTCYPCAGLNKGSDHPRLRERSVVARVPVTRGASLPSPCHPPPTLSLHDRRDSAYISLARTPFPTLLLGLGCSPRTRTRPSSPSQEWGEDRAGSTAGERGQQRLWEYSPRSARPLTPPPSLAQAGQRGGGGRGAGVRCPTLCQLPAGRQPQGGEL